MTTNLDNLVRRALGSFTAPFSGPIDIDRTLHALFGDRVSRQPDGRWFTTDDLGLDLAISPSGYWSAHDNGKLIDEGDTIRGVVCWALIIGPEQADTVLAAIHDMPGRIGPKALPRAVRTLRRMVRQ